MKTLIIAEAGSTHEGDLVKMLHLVDLAAAVGCDVFKNQWCSSPTRLAERRNAPDYEAAYRRIAYPVHWHQVVAERCATRGLSYACSAYLPEDIAVIAPLVAYVKIASFEAQDREMFGASRVCGRPVIVSTGMIEDESWLRSLCHHAFAVLHCVSSYVTPDEEANLAAIWRLRELAIGTDAKIGWSDHTSSPLSGAFAVAAGAEIVEFHLRARDAQRNNPDYDVSREGFPWGDSPASHYVSVIRLAERMLGDGIKRAMPSEAPWARYVVRG